IKDKKNPRPEVAVQAGLTVFLALTIKKLNQMYKNVLNQGIVVLIILFGSCFFAKSQTIATASASADNRSDHPPAASVTTAAKPQETDTTWKPVRRLWGYAFGDFYYDAHADAASRGAETSYAGVPTYRNAFLFRRLYLGYEYDITKKFAVEVLLASEPNANTNPVTGTTISNSDNLADNKMAFYIKNFALRVRSIWKGTDLVLGETLTPSFPLLTEKIWGYRSIDRTIADFH